MQTPWTIRETFGALTTSLLSGEVDLLFPWHGFSPAAMKVAHVALFKVFTRATAGPTPETLVESYQRGVDLVATYAQTPERNVRPQVYWRYVETSAQVAGLEIILSMQTSLLDSAPATSLESTLPTGEVIPLSIDVRRRANPTRAGTSHGALAGVSRSPGKRRDSPRAGAWAIFAARQ